MSKLSMLDEKIEGLVDREKLTLAQEKKLQDYFIDTRELGGMPITKDNCEDLFEVWLADLTDRELTNIINA